MSFVFDENQLALIEAVTDVLNAHDVNTLARADGGEAQQRRETLWSALHELGATSVLVPEEQGGLELSVVDAVAVSEASGSFLTPLPLVTSAAGFTPLLNAGLPQTEARDILEAIANGALGSVALSPQYGGSSGDTMHVDADGVHLNAAVVPLSSETEFLACVLPDGSEHPTVVCLRTKDLDVEFIRGMDETRSLARVSARGATPLCAIAGSPATERALGITYVTAAAEMIGNATAMLELATTYSTERKQFGHPIGSYQAVKHRLANSHIDLELARSLVYRAATDPTDTLAVHQAKLASSEAATAIARHTVQVHGGVGVTHEHDISLMYLRARQSATLFGSATFHAERAAAIEIAGKVLV